MATFLDMVNDVLIRLREDEVSSVNETTYSKFISKLVNDTKRSVEDAHTWNALSNTLTATTSNGISNYVLEGTGHRFKVLNVFEDTGDAFLTQRDSTWMSANLLKNNRQSGRPTYYNFNGVAVTGDTQVDLFPVPDGAYTIRFNLFIPQTALVSNTDVIYVPSDPVVLGAYARAVAERGEDNGLASADAYALYRASVADAIALDNSLFNEKQVWVAV
jgi:hypothetical protein